ncbi:MAG: hypothetical protein ACPL1Y_03575 [Thermoplasmata archaeon]
MTVKDRTGRRRYIVFQVVSDAGCTGGAGKVEVQALISRLRRDIKSLHLIQYRYGFGIVRVQHYESKLAIEKLNGHGKNFSLRTIVSTGTVKKARELLAKKAEKNVDLRY